MGFVKQHFLSDLEAMLLSLPIVGLACVIDRPGYNKRYSERYGRKNGCCVRRLSNISVEQATKFAMANDRKLRVYVERCSKFEDKVLEGYYSNLRNYGNCFDANTSSKYSPLGGVDYKGTLYDFKTKASHQD